MPRASSSSSSESPSQPGKEKCALPGSRAPDRSGSPLRIASGTAASTAPDQVVTQRGQPVGVLGLALHRELRCDREPGDVRNGKRPRAHVAFLPAAMQHRRDSDAAAEQ